MNNSYRVTIKVRNANLLRAIEKSCNKVGKEFCNKVGINYLQLNDLINLKRNPTDKNGDWIDTVVKLCVFLNVMPCMLFDEDQMNMNIGKNSSEFDSNLNQIKQLSIDEKSLQLTVDKIIGNLTPREEKVIIARFGLDCEEKTLQAIGDDLNVSKDRIRQIEQKALHKLRHPKNSIELKKFL